MDAVQYRDLLTEYQKSTSVGGARARSCSLLIAAPVLPPRPPPLLPLGAVKDRLAELDVDIVVRITEPLAELAAAAGLHGILADVRAKVVGTNPARVQLRKELDEADKVILL